MSDAPSEPVATEPTRAERDMPEALEGVDGWLTGGVNSVQRARDAQRLIDHFEVTRDENLREAWSHRKPSADVGDLAKLTGVLVSTVTRALYWHRPPTT